MQIPDIFLNKIKEVSTKLIANADRLQMSELWLFGSVARGTFSATSDIDFLVLTDNDDEHFISIEVEMLDLRDDIGYPNVDIIVRNRKSLSNNANSTFNDAVNRDRIILWER